MYRNTSDLRKITIKNKDIIWHRKTATITSRDKENVRDMQQTNQNNFQNWNNELYTFPLMLITRILHATERQNTKESHDFENAVNLATALTVTRQLGYHAKSLDVDSKRRKNESGWYEVIEGPAITPPGIVLTSTKRVIVLLWLIFSKMTHFKHSELITWRSRRCERTKSFFDFVL